MNVPRLKLGLLLDLRPELDHDRQLPLWADWQLHLARRYP
jgi:hypothetical protein